MRAWLNRWGSLALVSLILAVVFMNAARYIFKFGAPLSSPGYTSTPLIFWAIKYGLLLAIIGVIAVGVDSSKPRYYFAYGFVLIFTVIGLIETERQLIEIAAFYIGLYGFLFILSRFNSTLSSTATIALLIKGLLLLMLAAVGFLLLQLALYFGMNVMPSHSHTGSMLIRFGSFLDDSLAFGILLPMFAGLCFFTIKSPSERTMALLAVCLCSILSGSMTAMATTSAYTIWLLRRNTREAVAWVCLALLLILTFRWQLHELWLAKSGSIQGHLEGFESLSQIDDWLDPSPSRGFSESGVLLIFNNFSPPVLIGWLVFHVITFVACRRLLASADPDNMRPFVGAVEGLNFSAFIASFNLPVIMIFPVYLLLAIFSAAVLGLNEKIGCKARI
jgi:hypothetical protein